MLVHTGHEMNLLEFIGSKHKSQEWTVSFFERRIICQNMRVRALCDTPKFPHNVTTDVQRISPITVTRIKCVVNGEWPLARTDCNVRQQPNLLCGNSHRPADVPYNYTVGTCAVQLLVCVCCTCELPNSSTCCFADANGSYMFENKFLGQFSNPTLLLLGQTNSPCAFLITQSE